MGGAYLHLLTLDAARDLVACMAGARGGMSQYESPVPRKPKEDLSWVPKVYPRVDAIEFAWYCPADEMPPDPPQRYLRLAGEFIPQALPVRFGTYDPPQGDFARDGAEGFTKAWQDLVGQSLYLNTTYPVTGRRWDRYGTPCQVMSGAST